MSHLGKNAIMLNSATVSYQNNLLTVKGIKGELHFKIDDSILLTISPEEIRLSPKNSKKKNPMWGTTYSIIKNMVHGVNIGFQKEITLVGVGYRASLSGKKLELNLGFSHPIQHQLPEGVDAKLISATKIALESIDKQLLGQTAVELKKYRPPEPYKGKGVLLSGEPLLRKSGKSGKK